MIACAKSTAGTPMASAAFPRACGANRGGSQLTALCRSRPIVGAVDQPKSDEWGSEHDRYPRPFDVPLGGSRGQIIATWPPTGPGGGLSTGSGGGASTGPGGGLSTGPGGGMSTGPGGGLSADPGGVLSAGPGGGLSTGPPWPQFREELKSRGLHDVIEVMERSGVR